MSKDNQLNAVDVRAMTDEQLQDELLKLKKDQFHLRFQRARGLEENTAQFGKIRRNIARIRTVQSERKRQQEQGS